MAVDIGGALETFGWNSIVQFMQYGFWIFVAVVISIFIFGIWWWLSYKTPVTYYEPMGTDPVMRKEGESEDDYIKRFREHVGMVDLTKPKKDKGKFIRWRGVPYFKFRILGKKMKPVPYEMVYSDGVYLLRADANTFIPIERPRLNDNGMVITKMNDRYDLEFFNLLMADELNAKYRDEDREKKLLMLYVVVILGGLVFYGVALWLQYLIAGKQISEAASISDSLNAVAANLRGGNAPG